ncbi:conjugal transfer protein [Nitratireductor sp. GCM10026969]|uniref:conjugal transfer protein n=1 Tax=Nitratireductor sp. GCM10026969 TaxID=3252645 RepID=UPI00360DB638
MKISFYSLILILIFSNSAYSQLVVVDPAVDGDVKSVNSSVIKVNENASKILKNNKDILKTVKKINKHCKGDRKKDAKSAINLAINPAINFSATADLGELVKQKPEVEKKANDFISKLEGEDRQSDAKKLSEKTPAEVSYDELKKTVRRVAALVKGAQESALARRTAVIDATQTVGETSDIKGAIDANTQAQMQEMLTINEMIGVLNGVLASQQAENQRKLSNLSSMSKALSYGRRRP